MHKIYETIQKIDVKILQKRYIRIEKKKKVHLSHQMRASLS